MTYPPTPLTPANYAEAFERDMPVRLRQLFGELKAATRVLADAARCFAIIEAEYIKEKEKIAAKKGKKR